MFKYDSTHGPFKGTIKILDDSTLEINGKHVKVVSKRYHELGSYNYNRCYKCTRLQSVKEF